MSREKKDACNITIKCDREVYETLVEFCRLTAQTKTAIIERAIMDYTSRNAENAREIAAMLRTV